ncbi:MAG: type II toxin-antitoxin system VapC family toxin [Chloroflexi bacterium]|nr:type II toxin-antitoxin system VapC family toxin [Chloroflexota bacterium]
MKRYVTDTQCLLWYLTNDRRLPRVAQAAFQQAKEGSAQVLVPSIVLVEAVFLAERQRVPQTTLTELMALSEATTASMRVVPLDLAVARAVSDFGPSAVPELADRIVAATARALKLPLLTSDPAIEESGLVRVAK